MRLFVVEKRPLPRIARFEVCSDGQGRKQKRPAEASLCEFFTKFKGLAFFAQRRKSCLLTFTRQSLKVDRVKLESLPAYCCFPFGTRDFFLGAPTQISVTASLVSQGGYLAGKAGFEPATNRLTAERTTSVLLTQIQTKKKASRH